MKLPPFQLSHYNTATGSCYKKAFDYLHDPHVIAVLGSSRRLVHGYPYGSGRQKRRLKYGHAWIENSELVFDPGTPGLFHRKITYYRTEFINRQECQRYTLSEVYEILLTRKNYGPWGVVPPDVSFG